MVEGKEELVVDEPVFEMQEQAVVYLFSRYWERLPAFKDRVITRIHTHFPDFFVARKGKDDEAVEFDYKLSSLHSHLRGDVAKLRSRGIGKIYIVYWDEDDSVQVLTRKLQSLRLESVFVHLKEFFKAFVVFDEIAQRLRPSWRFPNV